MRSVGMDGVMTCPSDLSVLLEEILTQVRSLDLGGDVARYIPELAKVAPDKLGIAIYLADGTILTAGDAYERFSIQSISKLATLIMAYQLQGDDLWTRVGREPSGSPFNSLVQLEADNGIPRNPFINAGALVITDMLCSHYAHPDLAILEFLRHASGVPDLNFSQQVAQSEAMHGFRNAAMGNFIKSFGNLHAPAPTVLQTYFRQCAIEMSCRELVQAARILVHYGCVPGDGRVVLTAEEVRRIASVMLTCGTYDAAGDVAFRIGLPAKSGVGGGILAVIPGRLAICVWSPPLDSIGNSVAGLKLLELISRRVGWSIF